VRQMRTFWHTRPRVQRAPGIPCALWFECEDKEFAKPRAGSRRENALTRHRPRSGRSSIPETPVIEPRSLGVLDTPPSRRTTIVLFEI
jgi:hypothetical protein